MKIKIRYNVTFFFIFIVVRFFCSSASVFAEEVGDMMDYQQIASDILAAKPEARQDMMGKLAVSMQGFVEAGNFKKAEPAALALLSVSKVLNKDFPGDHALMLANVGKIFGGSGDLKAAKEYLAEAIEFAGKVKPENALEILPSVIQIYLDYGMITADSDENGTARESFWKAIVLLDIKELDNPGFKLNAYQQLIRVFELHYEDYETSVLLFEKLLSLFPPQYRSSNQTYLLSAFELTKLYIYTGNLIKAKGLLEELAGNIEQLGGKNSPDLGAIYQNLFHVYEKMGDYINAEKYIRLALDNVKANQHKSGVFPLDGMKSNLGEFSLGAVKNDLAMLYVRKGELRIAEQLFKELVDEISVTEGKESVMLEAPYTGLYRIYLLSDRNEEAEKVSKTLYHLAELYQKDSSIHLAKAMSKYAVALYLNGKKSEAVRLMGAAYQKAVANKGKDSLWLVGISSLWAKMLADKGNYPESYEIMNQTMAARYDNLIKELCGMSQKQSLLYLERQRYSLDSILINVVEHMKGDKDRVNKVFDNWLKYKGLVFDLEKFRQLTQNEAKGLAIAKSRDTFSEYLYNVDSRSLANSLLKAQVYIDYALVKVFDPMTEKNSGYRYLAFVFTNLAEPRVTLVDLGNADEIDNLVKKYGKEILTSTAFKQAPNENKLKALGVEMYTKIISPLESHITGFKELVVSPDGLLSLIPFDVMLTPSGEFLIDKYRIRTLSSARDIIRNPRSGVAKTPIVIFADPDYDANIQKVNPATPMPYSLVSGLGRQKFARLPDTAQEAECIVKKVATQSEHPYRLFQKTSASEINLFSMESPSILHIATHGFYLKKPTFATDVDDKTGKMSVPSVENNVDNPLLRSGIVLAGANHSLSIESDAGIITARKMMSLDLKDTNLVVLSACNTGVGDVEAGDGLVGLKRSILLAGSRSIITSMWNVASKQTVDLMDAFYLRYLGGSTKGDALREAKLKLKLAYPNPFYWGAMVLDGAWD
jgi:CHAT domain-containing protein/lipopolysaccharide biosynthesis regulator YciM